MSEEIHAITPDGDNYLFQLKRTVLDVTGKEVEIPSGVVRESEGSIDEQIAVIDSQIQGLLSKKAELEKYKAEIIKLK